MLFDQFLEVDRFPLVGWLLNVEQRTTFLIDNNRVEQLMKQVALGRKAWLIVGNVEAGEQTAMLMSLVSSARRHDLDVWTEAVTFRPHCKPSIAYRRGREIPFSRNE